MGPLVRPLHFWGAMTERPNQELLSRYERPTPRYTSYPPVPCWHAHGPDELAGALSRMSRAATPWQLYVHVPFCERRCWYCGCNVVIAPSRAAADPTVDAIVSEAGLAGPYFAGRPLGALHFGGGTPNFLSETQLQRLFGGLRGAFRFDAHTVVDMELDPRTLEAGALAMLAGLGVGRVSFGVQDLDPDVGAAIGRPMDAERVARCIRDARAAGISGVNLDLMYGLPRQTPESLTRTLRRLIVERPERFAIYGYAHVPAMRPQQRRLEPAGIPDADARLTLFSRAREVLVEAGYVPVGLDHFVVPSDPMARAAATGTLRRTFQGYTTHDYADQLGLGPSAISRITCADDHSVVFSQNAPADKVYRRALAEGRFAAERGLTVGGADLWRARLIEELMCHLRLRVPHGWAGLERERSALARFASDDLVLIEQDGLTVTERGRYFLRQVARVFDTATAAA